MGPAVLNSPPAVPTDGAMREGSHGIPDVRALGELWIASRSYRPASARQRRSFLRRFVAHVGEGRTVDSITDADVLAWWEATGHLKPETRRAAHSTVAGFLRWSVALGYGGTLALDLVRRPPVPRTVPKVLTEDQTLDLQLEVFGTPDELPVALMLHAGLRRAEVAAVRGEDVDHAAGLLTVRGKGGHTDVVPLPACVARLVPPGTKGRLVPVGAATVAERVVKAMHRAGVVGLTSHALRRTFATRLMHDGVPAIDVMRRMRHRSLGTTTRYVRSSFDA